MLQVAPVTAPSLDGGPLIVNGRAGRVEKKKAAKKSAAGASIRGDEAEKTRKSWCHRL